MRLRSFAKLNLHLQVVGRRPDGFHELVTIFQTVRDCDELEIAPWSEGVQLQIVEGRAPEGRKNLTVRAAQAYRERFAVSEGLRIRLRKRLPIGGGLGGGSSNAATVLWAMQRLHGAATPEQLLELAGTLGADVPYFLVGGTALGEGRGDRVRAMTELPEEVVWLVTPPVEVPTSAAFQDLGKLTSRPVPSTIRRLDSGPPVGGLRTLRGFNDLESVVFERYPQVAAVAEALQDAGADMVRMSGSGATLFAAFERQPEADQLRARLPSGCRVVQTTTLSREELETGRIINERIGDDGDHRDQGLPGP